MRVLTVSKENNAIRQRFFTVAYGDGHGYVCLAAKTRAANKFQEAFFTYPDDTNRMLEWINRNLNGRDLYYCPQLLSKPKRIKANVKECPTVWADLDEANPDVLPIEPSISLLTSPGRYQALWLLDTPAEPTEGERASRKLAYTFGADPSGWDLTQLLRIPLTYNMKYALEDTPIVEIKRLTEKSYSLGKFLELDDDPKEAKTDKDFPEAKVDELDPEEILERYKRKLVPSVYSLYTTAPNKDWSAALWSLECILLEAGLTPEEAFVVCENAAVNKYTRDRRPRSELWHEVLKAQQSVLLKEEDDAKAVEIGPLLTTGEQEIVDALPPTFIEKYIEWASAKSDAAPQYHQAGAFIILSSLLAENVDLPTSFGTIVPNLWFMILGDTTLTRKTTAMEMAMDLIMLVYEEAVLATDGSIEGLLTAISQRPKRTSLFWRDEFSGMLEAMRKRDYYAGMVEALTKLYDGKYQKRVLRKETIEVRDPIFIMFAGGIKSRILEQLDADYIINGFVPRFIFLLADPDMDRFKPVGPPTQSIRNVNTELVEELYKLREWYDRQTSMTIGDQHIATKQEFHAELTPEAWARYNELEEVMVQAGVNSDIPDTYTPAMDRLAKSGLKAAVLIAASRTNPLEETVTVELEDMLRAISYVDKWKDYTFQVVQLAGKTINEKTLDRAIALIQRGKDSRAKLMRAMKLHSRETEMLLDTLEQRGLIVRTKDRKVEKLFPTTLAQ